MFVLAVGTGCSDNEEGGGSPTPPACTITAPKDGAVLDLYEDVVIEGTASDPDGDIVKVALTVGGKAVAEVDKVPFTYTLPAENLKEGNLKIKLAVEDDGGNTAASEIAVDIKDLSQAPVCKLTAPAHGSVLNIFAPFTIKGEGEAVSGEIANVTLKIGDAVVPEVTALPFEYAVPAETYPAGNYIITLEVENSRGKTNKDMVAVTLADLNIAPACKITAPEAGASFEKEDVIVVTGTGSDEDGSIAAVELEINGQKIETVTAVPFEYTVADEYKVPGNLRIVLRVTDNNGKTSEDEVTATILGQFREFTDTRDGKVYKTVKIGSQLWFAENLAYLPQVMKPSEYAEDTPCYYVYGYDGNDVAAAKATESYQTRGTLYNWLAAGGSMTSKNDDMPSGIQGPCPAGWHMPSEAEWNVLFNYVRERIPDEEAVDYWGGTNVKNVSGHLRSKEGWPAALDEDLPDLAKGGQDTYGFAAQVTGCLLGRNGFYYGPGESGGKSCTFWTPHYDAVTFPSYPGAVTVGLNNYQYEPSYSRGTAVDRAYPVRCLQD